MSPGRFLQLCSLLCISGAAWFARAEGTQAIHVIVIIAANVIFIAIQVRSAA